MTAIRFINQIGYSVFMAAGHVMPPKESYRSPADLSMYYKATNELNRGSYSLRPIPLFKPMHPHKYHAHAANMMTDSFKELFDSIVSAVGTAHGIWCKAAFFSGVTIIAAAATAGPGCLRGPGFASLMKTAVMPMLRNRNHMRWAEYICQAIGRNFDNFVKSVTVPGLPLFPPFAAFPSPFAPSMPSVPTPLPSFAASQAHLILSRDSLKNAMVRTLPYDIKKGVGDRAWETLCDSLAVTLANGFSIWYATQMVVLQGMGPVPTFNPPWIPLGPVMSGNVLPSPGVMP